MNRLANASSRSTRLHDLRAKQDDDRCDVDPGKKSSRERERPVRREQGERSREVAERQLGDLPEHGRYERGPRRYRARGPSSRDRPVHNEEEDEADDKAGERREQAHAYPHQLSEPRPDEDPGYRRGSEREPERDDRQHGEDGHERGRLEVTAHERPSTLTTQHQRERTIQRTVDRHSRKDGAHNADR